MGEDKNQLNEKIDNAKRQFLYNIDPSTQKINKHIVWIMEHADKNDRWEDLLIELIAYLEFGFNYDEHKNLFDQFLAVKGLSKETVESLLVRKNLMQFKLSKRNIAACLVWIKKTSDNKTSLNKTAVVEWIYHLCHEREIGIYEFQDAVSHYLLIITTNIMRLENVTKGINYRIYKRE